MVNKNIQMKARNGNEWDNLFPLTLNENVFNNEGIGLTQQLENLQTLLNNNLNEFKSETNSTVNSFKTETNDKINSFISDFTEVKIGRYELIAHRGFRALSPENTMTAFSNALNNGADSLECDVQFSSDGVPMVIHDSTVNRTTNGTGSVNNLSYSYLRTLENNKSFSDNNLFSTTKIPSLEEFLIYSKGKSMNLYIEIKDSPSLTNIETMINLIKIHNLEERTCIQSFSFKHLNSVRQYSEKINFGYLSRDEPSSSQYNQMDQDGNTSLLASYDLITNTPNVFKKCLDKNIAVGCWTVNDYDVVERLLNIGVTKIMSDYALKGVN